MQFLTYEVKVAAILLVFYLFYRFLLKKETFHRFNRAMLVGTAILSFILPFCIITIKKSVELPFEDTLPSVQVGSISVSDIAASSGLLWWQIALIVLFWVGAALVVLRVILYILSIRRIMQDYRNRQGDRSFQLDALHSLVSGRLSGQPLYSYRTRKSPYQIQTLS